MKRVALAVTVALFAATTAALIVDAPSWVYWPLCAVLAVCGAWATAELAREVGAGSRDVGQ